jgi:hypothetical protein
MPRRDLYDTWKEELILDPSKFGKQVKQGDHVRWRVAISAALLLPRLTNLSSLLLRLRSSSFFFVLLSFQPLSTEDTSSWNRFFKDNELDFELVPTMKCEQFTL